MTTFSPILASRQMLKVTSRHTKLTYRNIYCGMCNGETLDDLVSWTWNFDCSEAVYENRIMENVTNTDQPDLFERYK